MTTGVDDAATSQTTISTYDLGGRVTEVNDEFACTRKTYDYRDLAQTVIQGLTPGSPCTGSGMRTVTNTYDGRGRLTVSQVTAGLGVNDKTVDDTFDAAGNKLSTSATRAGVTTSTTSTINPLDQVTVEQRSDGTWAKTNYDAAGNPTDRCLWPSQPTDPCKAASSMFANPQPSSVTTTTFDARSNRISLADGASSSTTTYDSNHNYQASGFYLPTADGKEHQTIHAYDERHRLASVSQMLCATSQRPCSGANILVTTASETHSYDDSDNRTRVNENNGSGLLDRYYCYDAVNRVLSTRSASGCSSGLIESYAYDDSGNRTAAAGVTFTYNGSGQLSSCSPACGTVAHDAAGRIQKWNGWAFEYDAEGRMTRGCQSTTDCGGLYNELEYTYDGDGHRTQIKEYDAGNANAVATWDFRYQGNALVEEKLTDSTHAGVVVRSYVVDESGSIVKMIIPGGEPNPGTYLLTWNGHGDALALWRIEQSTGGLTLANSFTYDTWGQPTTVTANGFPDLGFRFLYVGHYGVQWDNLHGMRLYYARSRHYAPTVGRFLQPDAASAESNLYTYAGDNPISSIDPCGSYHMAPGTTLYRWVADWYWDYRVRLLASWHRMSYWRYHALLRARVLNVRYKPIYSDIGYGCDSLKFMLGWGTAVGGLGIDLFMAFAEIGSDGTLTPFTSAGILIGTFEVTHGLVMMREACSSGPFRT